MASWTGYGMSQAAPTSQLTSRTIGAFGNTGTPNGQLSYGPIFNSTFSPIGGGGQQSFAAPAQQPAFSGSFGGGGYTMPTRSYTTYSGGSGSASPTITPPTVGWQMPTNMREAVGGGAAGATSQAQPRIDVNANPIWNSQMMRNAGAETLAGSQAAARSQANQNAMRAAANGFGANSPSLTQRNAVLEALGTMGGTSAAGQQMRDMAAKNQAAVYQGQGLQSQEAQRLDETAMANARNLTSGNIASGANSTQASIANAGNAIDLQQMGLNAALANAQMNLQAQLGQGDLGIRQQQVQYQNPLFQSLAQGPAPGYTQYNAGAFSPYSASARPSTPAPMFGSFRGAPMSSFMSLRS